jgi:hypothetical protein
MNCIYCKGVNVEEFTDEEEVLYRDFAGGDTYRTPARSVFAEVVVMHCKTCNVQWTDCRAESRRDAAVQQAIQQRRASNENT